jgi:predicted HTH transcriptional regulator
MDPTLLETLLHDEESASLDFKRDQYRFEGALDDDKCELLKDILAFANSWRHSDAFILVGVDDVRGRRSRPVGVSSHLNDAELQQFVNSKTQKPIRFAYEVHSVDGIEIGIIRIPIQLRSFFLKKDYGWLKKDLVYIRRGSSTATADPDEIMQMALASLPQPAEPRLSVEARATGMQNGEVIVGSRMLFTQELLAPHILN